MSYLVTTLFTALVFGIALHLRNQFRQTAHIRLRLQQARSNKTLNGMHSLRNRK